MQIACLQLSVYHVSPANILFIAEGIELTELNQANCDMAG